MSQPLHIVPNRYGILIKKEVMIERYGFQHMIEIVLLILKMKRLYLMW